MVTELRQQEDLDQLLDQSKTDPVLIFKHSTQCPISTAAYDELTRFIEEVGDVICGVVLVVENRAISNRIASELGIPHESPQAIVVKNGRPKWNASHWSITTGALSKALTS